LRARGLEQFRDLFRKDLSLRHPGADLCFLELHKIDVIPSSSTFR